MLRAEELSFVCSRYSLRSQGAAQCRQTTRSPETDTLIRAASWAL